MLNRRSEMTPEEQAKNLVERFWERKFFANKEEAVECALMTTADVIRNCRETTKLYEGNDMINSDVSFQPLDFWLKVQIELFNYECEEVR